MTRWEVFRMLAGCLAPALSRDHETIRLPAAIPWEQLIEAAEDHLVSPALGWCLRDDPRVPPEVRPFFATLLDLNRDRNALILRGLDDALQSLNSIGITPLLLKGTAALAEDLYPDHGMRILSDIDLLIPVTKLEAASAALTSANFVATTINQGLVDRDHHHLPVQVHEVHQVGVELHSGVLPRGFQRYVDTETCWRNSRPLVWRQRHVRLPGPTDRVSHNIAHAQIVDGHYWRGAPRLRQLLELELLRQRYGEEIDTRDLENRFAIARHAAVLSDTLAWATGLLRQDSLPASAATYARLRRLEHIVEHPERQRWSLYRRLIARNTQRVMTNPRFLLNALRPGFWQAELEGIRRRSTPSRW